MSRYLSSNGVALGVVGVLIALIGTVTLFATDLVNDTVEEQFRSQELQLASSLAQQTATYFNSLYADITSLSLQPDIKSKAVVEHDAALALMEEHAHAHAGVIRTIIRFKGDGSPRYGYPLTLNAALKAHEPPPYQVPTRLLDLIAEDQSAPFDLEIVGASRGPAERTFLLIAPVTTPLNETEFLVYELDLTALFAQIMGVVELEGRGQLWVIDNLNEVLFQATATVPLEALLDRIPLASLASTRSPRIADYRVGGDDRLAVIAPIQPQGNKTFVVILSRTVDTAAEQVQADLQRIFAMTAGAILLVAGLAWVAMHRLNVAARRHQDEVQRRQTARMLLEISRALNSTLDLQDVLRSIMAELANIVPYDSAAVLLLDRSRLLVAAHRGADAAAHAVEELDLDKAHAANQVLQTGRPLVIEDTQTDERWTVYDQDSIIRSWMGIPLRVREKTVGVLNINSHRVRGFSPEQIELAEAFADQASVALQNARLHEFEVKQIDQELRIARELQTSLLPSTAPVLPQLEIMAYTLPARQVSGDYFQYMPLPDGRLGIAVGDVSGKGIPAAMLMAVITTALRDEVTRHARPAELLNALNRRLLDRMRTTHLNSGLLVGIFDPPTRHLELANGGMVQPYVRSGQRWEFVPVGGYPLGVSQRLEYTSKVVTLAPGATLLMMTDGVVEAQNAAGEFYGFDRLEALLNGLPRDLGAQELIERIVAAVRAHLGGEEPQDDVTMVVLRSVEVPESSRPRPGQRAGTTPPSVDPASAPPPPESRSQPSPPSPAESGGNGRHVSSHDTPKEE